MLVLGLETSCDDTAVAVLKDGNNLLSNVINDQTKIHSKYGGIVPELAGRSHIEQIHRVITQSLISAQQAPGTGTPAQTRRSLRLGGIQPTTRPGRAPQYEAKRPKPHTVWCF